MPIPDVRLQVRTSSPSLVDDFVRRSRTIYDDEALELADRLQQASPVGATGELKAAWDVIPARRQVGDIRVAVINTADNAYSRIVGRGPGKFPPVEPVEAWVRTKVGGSEEERRRATFLIRRKIAREGTERYKRKDNILRIQPRETVDKSPLIQETRERIIARINDITLD
ncbi:MAG: HK97 gp10 family phage protein [Cyanobacteria bacterium J06627_8]